jgi:hypothetical protein
MPLRPTTAPQQEMASTFTSLMVLSLLMLCTVTCVRSQTTGVYTCAMGATGSTPDLQCQCQQNSPWMASCVSKLQTCLQTNNGQASNACACYPEFKRCISSLNCLCTTSFWQAACQSRAAAANCPSVCSTSCLSLMQSSASTCTITRDSFLVPMTLSYPSVQGLNSTSFALYPGQACWILNKDGTIGTDLGLSLSFSQTFSGNPNSISIFSLSPGGSTVLNVPVGISGRWPPSSSFLAQCVVYFGAIKSGVISDTFASATLSCAYTKTSGVATCVSRLSSVALVAMLVASVYGVVF